MLEPTNFGLRKNPFSTVPDAEVRNWAGLPETKTALADVVRSVRLDDVGTSEFVIMQGDYGAGKSHALRYFTHEINEEGYGHAIYVSEIRGESGLSFASLARRIVAGLDDETVRRLATRIREFIDAEKNVMQQRAVEAKIPAPDDANAVIRNTVFSQSDYNVVERLYHDGRTAEISDNASDYVAAKTLASLFRVMVLPLRDGPPAFGAIYLFLDEVESAWEEKAAKQVAFLAGLRSLLNEINERFAVVLSFTSQTALLEAAMPDALRERMTRSYVQCEQLTTEGAKRFIVDYLKYVRPSTEYVAPQPFYPFSEAAIDTILDRESALVPRRILLRLRRVWERAARSEQVEVGGEIAADVADHILAGVV